MHESSLSFKYFSTTYKIVIAIINVVQLEPFNDYRAIIFVIDIYWHLLIPEFVCIISRSGNGNVSTQRKQ